MVIFAVLWNTLFLLDHGKAFVLPGVLFKKIFRKKKSFIYSPSQKPFYSQSLSDFHLFSVSSLTSLLQWCQ